MFFNSINNLESKSTLRRYPALEIIAKAYQIIACIFFAFTVLGCLIGFLILIVDIKSGLITIFASFCFGSLFVVNFFAIAESIRLAIDMADDIKAMSDHIRQNHK